MARVYSYIRFSDAKQAAGASSERQRAYAQQWAKDHGLVLDDQLTLRDEGLSAYHQKHVTQGALGAFLRAVEDGAVPSSSVLVVEGLDRLSRAEPLQAQAQLASIVNAGIKVVTASDGKVYSREGLKANPMDLVYSLLVMIRAHEESDTKSRRVRDAIRRQCQGWQAGTYRGLIRYGKTPSWLQVVDGQWQLIEPRAAALRAAVDMFLHGLGTGHIARELHSAGLAVSNAVPSSGHLVRLLAHPALIGDKHLDLDGETFHLLNYYPAVISREVWAELQELTTARSRRNVRGEIPSILTGFGVSVCGYCGGPLKSQTMASKRRSDGTLSDGHRRLQCVRINDGDGCSVSGSCSAAPVERALMNYCSDIVNLQALYRGDRSAIQRGELALAKSRLTDIEGKLERLTSALLESDDAPITFVRRARELEDERGKAQELVTATERAVAESARANIHGADVRWRALIEGVDSMRYEDRATARQLVADTFERIVVYRRGIRPAETTGGSIDVMLHAKGGTSRMLRVDKHGCWIAAENVDCAATAASDI
jgi:DNA invertase Pin-like site-specific DNA recombinase